MEVKFVDKLNLEKACEQAERDAGLKAWIVAHKRNGKHWKVTMDAGTFFQLLREGMDCFIEKEDVVTKVMNDLHIHKKGQKKFPWQK
jgi:hypothetical protein